MKPILDATCGSRSMWFNKKHPMVVYCDKRREHHEKRFGANNAKRTIDIAPDIQCDFTDLPFPDNAFHLVVFDPPHIVGMSENAWYAKFYGTLTGDWRIELKQGFDECMRVLKPYGKLDFKWADISVSVREIIEVFGQDPLIGHRSGKKAGTHWMTFMKFPQNGGDEG